MAKVQLRFLAVALCTSFTLAAQSEGTLLLGASKGDALFTTDLMTKAPADRAGFAAGGEVKICSAPTTCQVYTIKSIDADEVTLTTPLTEDYATGATVTARAAGGGAGTGPILPGVPTPEGATATTTLTGWDSSASSGSMSLDSLNSGSLHQESSSSDSGSNLSDSASSGSTASGSWGSYLEFWQWLALALVACCCCCGAAGGATMKKNKSKKKKTKPQAPAPIPVSQGPEAIPEAVAVTDPLVMPLQPAALPSYTMGPPTYAAGMTYAAPATMSLAYPFAAPGAPTMESYAYAPAGPAPESYYAAAMPTAQYAPQYAPQYATTGLAQY